MRLTLRTMLAFLDDLLEPADAQDVGKRIEESEFATSLMHRTRDVTRRLRLGAPKLEGRGMGLDPNTVAEYLDHALPPERVPDFEKVCLESDVHLAEVASAHQILTLVLGEPAEVDPQMRRRMYGIAAQSEAAAEADVEANGEAGTDAIPEITVSSRRAKAGQRESRRRPEVPDYLREQSRRSRWKPLVAAALVLLLLGGGAFVALGPMQGWRMLAMGPSTENKDATDKQSASGTESTQQKSPDDGTELTTGGDSTDNGEGSHPADATADAGDAKKAPPKGPPPDLTSPPDGATQATPTQPDDESPAAPPPADLLPPVDGNIRTSAKLPTENPGPGNLPPPPAPMPDGPMPPALDAPPKEGARPALPMDPLLPKTAGAQPPAGGVPPAASGAAPPGAAPARPPAEAVGSLATDVEVLLRLDRKSVSATNPASQAWQRVSSREFLYPGDELLVLPTFRTNVVLSAGGGVKVQILGGAVLTLEPPDDQGVPGLRILEGRLIIMPTGKPGSQVRLNVGQLQGALVFGDADATAAIEVHRSLVDGDDPEKQPAQLSVDLYVPAGVVTWVPGPPGMRGGEDMVKAPGRRSLGAAGQSLEPVATTAKVFPEWIAGTGPTPTDKARTDEFEKELVIGKPVHLRLKEIAFRDRRYDYRSLAARCLFELGDFETFLPLLSDPIQKAYWTNQIEAVRSAMARSPEMAIAVKTTIGDQRDVKTGDELYRMLWGYTRKELRKGAAARLVDELDHDDLDIREMAFWNLFHVTGYTLNYRPQDVPAKRQQSVAAWKKKLKDDLIVPK